jgi:hypothetical protein
MAIAIFRTRLARLITSDTDTLASPPIVKEFYGTRRRESMNGHDDSFGSTPVVITHGNSRQVYPGFLP